MVDLVRIAIRRPYTFVVLAMLIMLFGILSVIRTPTDIFPNIGIPVISAVWTYNGLPADQMSGRIVYFYERTLSSQINDIEHIESQSLAGYGVVKIFFQPSVNINAALAQVTAASQTVLKLLPAGVTPPYVLVFNASSVPILQLALSSSELSQTRLNDLGQNFIRPQLATVPGTAIPSPYGGKVRQIQVDLNQRALLSYKLSAQDVVNALAAQNLITPVGTEKNGRFEYTVQLNDSPLRVDSFNSMPVKRVNGTLVYMHDVATVHDSSPPQTNVVQVDGHNAVLMTILKSGAASTLDIIAGVKKLLPQIAQSMPTSLKLDAVGDQSTFVKEAVTAVVREGLIAAGLTGLMIMLFLGSWRSTLIISLSIPLSVLASLTTLSAIGETINVMTLGGLALAVGILVDEATVTIENINWHLEQGKPVTIAIMDGANQIVIPALVSLLSICIAFVPLFGLGGVAGYLFRPLAEAVVFAMIASFILSRTLVPTMANYLLKGEGHEHGAHDPHAPKPASRNPLVRFQHGFERGFVKFRDGYSGLLALALRNRVRLVSGFGIATVASLLLFPSLGEDFFPTIDSGQIKIHMRAQTGTRIEESTRLAVQVDQAIREIIPAHDVVNIVNNIGMPISGINVAYGNSGTIGVQDGDILVSLTEDHGPTAEYIHALRRELPRRFPGTGFAFLPADMVTQILNFGSPAPIDVQVAGNDLPTNRVYAQKLLARIREIPGIADPRIQQAFQEPTLNVNVDRSLAGQVDLQERDAATSMLDTLAGSTQTAPTFWLNPQTGVSYPVSVQTPQYHMDTMGDLRNMPLTGGNQSQLLGGLATVVPGPSNVIVSHYNVRPVIDIYASADGRDLGAVANDIREAMADTAKDLPRGATVTLRGQVTTMSSAYSQLYFGLAFSMVLVYLLIVVNFQSWLDPFVIVLALPFALAGITWMLFVTHTTLSVPALTGAIMTMGVATANSILVISFARERLGQGVDALTAAMEAGSTRLRPVLMTALAMVVGMLPMAIEPGQNAPLGRAVIGGLIFATCATLFFVPTVFSMVHAKDKRAAPDHDGAAHGHASQHG